MDVEKEEMQLRNTQTELSIVETLISLKDKSMRDNLLITDMGISNTENSQAKGGGPDKCIKENRARNIANKYTNSSKGPFEVHVEACEEDSISSKAKPSDIKFGKEMAKIVPNIWRTAFNLRALGMRKFTVSFPNGDMANELIKLFSTKTDMRIASIKWDAYISDYRICTKVTTTDFDLAEPAEDIMEGLMSPPHLRNSWPKLLSVKHIIFPTQARSKGFTLLAFEGTDYPKAAIYYGKKIRFMPYIQKSKRCLNCQRFGHFMEQCRGGSAARVCRICAKNKRTKIIMAKLGAGPLDAAAFYKAAGFRLGDC
ncbi:uncharacterized protein LOC116850434 isoform X2 [Odontomachus brunneus]|uniref:uncharacterized protein LOC116850434 isoform X2 n=1 Tax=Odontomachus brunneus TaxID=486640 RepID=UPI0013F18121|nr:uncharacterized protein LOC116850434 isoform X2 [Odontomachus brunneus]